MPLRRIQMNNLLRRSRNGSPMGPSRQASQVADEIPEGLHAEPTVPATAEPQRQVSAASDEAWRMQAAVEHSVEHSVENAVGDDHYSDDDDDEGVSDTFDALSEPEEDVYPGEMDNDLLWRYEHLVHSEDDGVDCVRPFSIEHEDIGASDDDLEFDESDVSSQTSEASSYTGFREQRVPEVEEGLYDEEPSRSDLREFSTQAVETRQELLTSTAAQWRNSAMFQRMVASVYSGPGAVRRRMLMQEHPQLLLTDLDMQLPGMVNLETEEEDRLLQDALLNLRNTLPRRKPHGIKRMSNSFSRGGGGMDACEEGHYRSMLNDDMKAIVDDADFIDDVLRSLPGVDPNSECILATLETLREDSSMAAELSAHHLPRHSTRHLASYGDRDRSWARLSSLYSSTRLPDC